MFLLKNLASAMFLFSVSVSAYLQDTERRTTDEKSHFFMCVFLPISLGSRKDKSVSEAQMDTWIDEAHKRGDVRVFFIGNVLSERHRHLTISIPFDENVKYKHLPVRTFKMWRYLGTGEKHLRARLNEQNAPRWDSIMYNQTGNRAFWSAQQSSDINPAGGGIDVDLQSISGGSESYSQERYGGATGKRRTATKRGQKKKEADVIHNGDASPIERGVPSRAPTEAAEAHPRNDFRVSSRKPIFRPDRNRFPGFVVSIPDNTEETHAARQSGSGSGVGTLDDWNFLPHTAIDTENEHFWWPPFDEQVSCDWNLKADPDTYVNVPAVVQRLKCFSPDTDSYLGVVHVVAPDQHTSLFFGHGGSGYLVSKKLLPSVGDWSEACLSENIKTSDGVGMEDVLFARCLRDHGNLTVAAYGHTYSEYILNFHQTSSYVLNGTWLTGNHRYDILPPPVTECTLVAHPFDRAEDLRLAHRRFFLEPRYPERYDRIRGWRMLSYPPHRKLQSEVGNCHLAPFEIARQAETQLSKGNERMMFWSKAQMKSLYQCYKNSLSPRSHYECEFEPETEKWYGLKQAPDGHEAEASCRELCCDCTTCALYLWRQGDGCWLAHHETVKHGKALPDPSGPWFGGRKVWQDKAIPLRFAERVRNWDGNWDPREPPGEPRELNVEMNVEIPDLVRRKDDILDLYARDESYATYVNRLMEQGERETQFMRRVVRRYENIVAL